MQATTLHHRAVQLATAALLLALALAASAAQAGCSFENGTNIQTVFYSPATNITVAPSAAIGDILYSGPVVAPGTPYTEVTCDSTDFSYGLNNLTGNQPNAGESIFPTGIDGIGYRFAYNSGASFLPAYPIPIPSYGTNHYVFRVGVSLQFVKTAGTFTGGTLSAGSNLANQKYDNLPVQVFALNNSATFVQTGCQLTAENTTVLLPTVTTGAFLGGAGSTAGDLDFSIGFSCADSNTTPDITLGATPDPGASGVLTAATGPGHASGVDVRILSGSNPVHFGIPTALVPGSTSVSYTAQYIQTGSTVGVGSVSATATYTLSYQ